MYDRHPRSAGFFSPSPWGKNLSAGLQKGHENPHILLETDIPTGEWSTTIFAGKSTVFISTSLFDIFSLALIFLCILILVFPRPAYRHRAFHRKGRESISIAAYRGLDRRCGLWQLAQNLPRHNAIAEIWQHYLCIERHYAFLFLIKNTISTFMVIYSWQYIHIIAV